MDLGFNFWDYVALILAAFHLRALFRGDQTIPAAVKANKGWYVTGRLFGTFLSIAFTAWLLTTVF